MSCGREKVALQDEPFFFFFAAFLLLPLGAFPFLFWLSLSLALCFHVVALMDGRLLYVDLDVPSRGCADKMDLDDVLRDDNTKDGGCKISIPTFRCPSKHCSGASDCCTAEWSTKENEKEFFHSSRALLLGAEMKGNNKVNIKNMQK